MYGLATSERRTVTPPMFFVSGLMSLDIAGAFQLNRFFLGAQNNSLSDGSSPSRQELSASGMVSELSAVSLSFGVVGAVRNCSDRRRRCPHADAKLCAKLLLSVCSRTVWVPNGSAHVCSVEARPNAFRALGMPQGHGGAVV